MRHQQVTVDYWAMIKTSLTYLALVGSFCVLLRMTYAVFMLPRALRTSQARLSDSLKMMEAKLEARQQADELAKKNKLKDVTDGIESEDTSECQSTRAIESSPQPTITTTAADDLEPKKDL